MKALETSEPDCLERLAFEQSGIIPPCTGDTLLRLESRGRIEKSPRIWLASPLVRHTCRLTAAGQALLRRQQPRPGKGF